MKILLVTFEFPPQIGGMENYYYNLIKHTKDVDYTVLTLPSKTASDFDKQQNFKIIRKKLLGNLIWPRWLKLYLLIKKTVKKEKIDLIFCSDYLRTKQTAEIVAKALNLKIIADIKLGDTDIGDCSGKPKVRFYDEFSDPIKRFELAPKNGESWNSVKERLSVFLEEIEAKYLGKNILIVGHGDSLWLFDGLIQESTNQELIDIIFKKKEYIKKGELRKIN